MNSVNERTTPRIMVVEDENIVALDIANGLKRLGYEVVKILSTGEDAIESALNLHPDLILMDIQLKGSIDGIQAAGIIRQKSNIPVIFLTAYADEATIEKAKGSEPYGYLLKPFEESELHTAIEIVLQKHKKVTATEAHYVKELILSEERFKLFINSVYDYAIVMLDTAGNIVSWNAGVEKILGYSSDEVIGKHHSIFYEDKDIKENLPAVILAKAAKQTQYVEENWRVRKDGTRIWTHITISALFDGNKNLLGFGAVIHDMTRTKMTEEILRSTVKARDEFISIASHELKTPLTSLMLQTQSFKRSQKRNDISIYEHNRVNKIVEQTYKQVVRLSRLVEDMLDISRIRSGKFEMNRTVVNFSELVLDVLEKMSAQFQNSGCGIPLINMPENISGEWDKDRIEQVLTNLLSNAIRYAPGKPIEVVIKDDGTSIKLEVIDHGEGIDKKDHEKIFERFERAVDATNTSGMGLGLFISKQIVEAHGGKIWVESEKGKGATFIVVLPKRMINQKAKVEASPTL